MAKYSKASQKKVEKVMHEMHEGKLKSGKGGNKVTNPKQAIVIGLSEARAEGDKVPKESTAKKTSAKTSAPKKSSTKKSTPKKSAPKKSSGKESSSKAHKPGPTKDK